MAYRRRHGISRASTFKEEFCEKPSTDLDENATNDNSSQQPRLSSSHSFTPTSSSNASSLAAQAIKASAARRDPSFSFALNKSSLAPQHEHHRSKSLDACGDVPKSGIYIYYNSSSV
ncbi:hypothetical protein SESBI_22483 [Sesbania bispinosa]|nr:hypothetical protein SESBI_22483 [Sesbania bispinosa]